MRRKTKSSSTSAASRRASLPLAIRDRAEGRRRDGIPRRALRPARRTAHPHQERRCAADMSPGRTWRSARSSKASSPAEQGRARAGDQRHARLHARGPGRYLLPTRPDTFLNQKFKAEVTQFDRAREEPDRQPAEYPGAREGRAEGQADGRDRRGPDPPRHGAQRDGLRRVRRSRRARRAAARQRRSRIAAESSRANS